MSRRCRDSRSILPLSVTCSRCWSLFCELPFAHEHLNGSCAYLRLVKYNPEHFDTSTERSASVGPIFVFQRMAQ